MPKIIQLEETSSDSNLEHRNPGTKICSLIKSEITISLH